ncbi:hypothetical protein [Chelatococcus reniformis]|uniref:Uncharacterized protein n=1 Tax=Chelatococcus reniformis TaxID=1494448 RepID=A0A916UFB3_9HYPH|nr:hypothetical protein [Chelatococcus reniformis]GGC70640.1 hypothetical protein GCM10010994_31490 [Chelatococcus reniformis]
MATIREDLAIHIANEGTVQRIREALMHLGCEVRSWGVVRANERVPTKLLVTCADEIEPIVRRCLAEAIESELSWIVLERCDQDELV